MTIIFMRLLFIIITTSVGYQLGSLSSGGAALGATGGAIVGLLGAVAVILLEVGSKKMSVRGLSSAVFGLIFGLIIAKLLTDTLVLLPIEAASAQVIRVIVTLVFCYFGMVIAMRGRDEFNIIIPYVKFSRQDQKDELILLDTSVIIDGRIADICQTKFIDGRLVIPRFILKELQQIADSQDPLKRTRGRRGLDILNKIQKSNTMDVKIDDEDFPDIHEVDSKLVKLAKMLGAKIFTNDFNLNKIAELQGIAVLNINELANALKSVVLPGELMEVKLIREGKEHNQAVAYLDDGTMIVVDNSRHLIGRNIRVIVTSALQTQAGRMIFAKLENEVKNNGHVK